VIIGGYYIFRILNMKLKKIEKQIAEILKVLGSPFRIKILYAIGEGEACVCHLEALLKKRQAYISQHLMVLRDAGLLSTRREGKYIFYRVADLALFDLLKVSARMIGLEEEFNFVIPVVQREVLCDCPKCQEKLEKIQKTRLSEEELC
jgi:ArsR family transcriptional regulator